MTEAEKIRVALVDDHSIVRRGLSAVLTTSEQLELVGEAEDGQDAIKLCEQTQPNVVLMDLIMPRMDGIEATRAIHQRWPEIQILVLTSFTEQEMIQGALDAGARGYLLKNVKGRELIDAIVQVHQGVQAIAQEARQSLHLSEQISMLEDEIFRNEISTASITDSLRRHLPNLFQGYKIQVRLFPDQDLFITPYQETAPFQNLAWEWLQNAVAEKIIFRGGEMPWGGIQTWGEVMLLTPIQGNNHSRPLGGIGLLSGDTTPDVADLAKISGALAGVLASAVDSLRRSSQQASSTSPTDELQVADMLQSRIMPENPPILNGWKIASRLVPSRETSGDFFDFIPLANDTWGILIADLTDKGLGAAVFMAMCSSLIRTYATRFPTLPALVFSSVNERIITDMRGGSFLTAFYGILEPQTGRLRYVNAGHNPPILLGKNKPVEKLDRTGLALGVSQEATWQHNVIALSPDDVLVLYTDGITEAHNYEGDQFSEYRLQSTINGLRGKTAAEVLEVILEEINRFTAGAPEQDDMALIVMSREH